MNVYIYIIIYYYIYIIVYDCKLQYKTKRWGEQIDTHLNDGYPTIPVISESGHEERNVSIDGLIEPTAMHINICIYVNIHIYIYMYICGSFMEHTYIYI